MTNNNHQHPSPASPPLPPLPHSNSSSPALSSLGRFNPQPINIGLGSSSLEPAQPSPRRGSIAAHLMSFAARSTTSLHLLSSSAPTNSSSTNLNSNNSSSVSSHDESRSQVLPLRSSPFSNPFKKLQNTFIHSTTKKSLEIGAIKQEKVASSSASVHSMVSWRSKGAEMLSKKHWGRARKNSEPTYGASNGLEASPIFGASLEEAVRMSHIPGSPMVPAVLFRCAEYLEAKGVDEVGLYRVPGSHASVQKLKKMFDAGKDINLLTMEATDPNDIATLLKLYLRELPTPLLPAVFLEQFQSIISTDRQVCHSLRGILIRLPRPNYVVLSFLCHHLSRIAAHADKTKMNVSNLGVVFAPTLSIGSILFKALLGGYYDAADTPESREKGLKIVWGGLLQDFDYGAQEDWPEESMDNTQAPMGGLPYQSTTQLPLTPAQEMVNAASLAIPAASHTSSASTSTGLAFTQSMPDDHQYSPVPHATPVQVVVAARSAEEEEAKLMTAMLLREELAANNSNSNDDDETASNASSSSGSIPCTDTTALSAVSSPGLSTKEHAFEAAFTSPSMAFSPTMTSTATLPSSAADAAAAAHDIFSPPSSATSSTSSSASSVIPIIVQTPIYSSLPQSSSSSSAAAGAAGKATTAAAASTYPAPPTINITIDSGSLLMPSLDCGSSSLIQDASITDLTSLTRTVAEKEEVITHASEDFYHKSASGAPQLPPLEGLMIAL